MAKRMNKRILLCVAYPPLSWPDWGLMCSALSRVLIPGWVWMLLGPGAEWLRLTWHSAIRPVTLYERMWRTSLSWWRNGEKPEGTEQEFNLGNSHLRRAGLCFRNRQNLSALDHRDLVPCFVTHVQQSLAGEQCSLWSLSPHGDDVCFHHHCHRGKERHTLHVVHEGFCPTSHWRNECRPLLRRRRSGMFENSLCDHSTPHSCIHLNDHETLEQ